MLTAAWDSGTDENALKVHISMNSKPVLSHVTRPGHSHAYLALGGVHTSVEYFSDIRLEVTSRQKESSGARRAVPTPSSKDNPSARVVSPFQGAAVT